MCMQSFDTDVFWKGCTHFVVALCLGLTDLHWFPCNLPKINILNNAKESGKNPKTLIYLAKHQNIKYMKTYEIYDLKLRLVFC